MSIKLVRQALRGERRLPRMWHVHELKDRYDAVIIGGGAHGLCCAYYLAVEHGITNVAVLENATSVPVAAGEIPPLCAATILPQRECASTMLA